MNGESLPRKKSGFPLFVWLRLYRNEPSPIYALLAGKESGYGASAKDGDIAEEMFYRFIRRNPNKYLACDDHMDLVFKRRYAPRATRGVAPWGFGFYRTDELYKRVICDRPKGRGKFYKWLCAVRESKAWKSLSRDEQTARILIKQIGDCNGN